MRLGITDGTDDGFRLGVDDLDGADDADDSDPWTANTFTSRISKVTVLFGKLILTRFPTVPAGTVVIGMTLSGSTGLGSSEVKTAFVSLPLKISSRNPKHVPPAQIVFQRDVL